MRKADIEQYYEHGRPRPSVNVKAYAYAPDMVPMLPMELGRVGNVGQVPHAVYTHADFTIDWIESNVTEQDQQAWWDEACGEGWEQAQEVADDVFSDYPVKVWSAGRSGGHLIVDGLPDIEEWNGGLVAKWSKFVRIIEAIRDDTKHRYLWLLYANVFENQQFDVSWNIELDGASPREAAEKALEILRSDDPGNLGLAFTVKSPGGMTTTIDLSPGTGRHEPDLSTD
jgi:hypothetical protein